MRRSFKYRAKISNATKKNTFSWFYYCRTLYNLALEQRIEIYKQRKETPSSYSQIKQLPELKKAFPEFKQVGSQVLQDVIERVDKAFQGFFRRVKSKQGKAGFPRFKGKFRYHSFTLKQAGWKLEGRNLTIKNVGTFKLYLSRPIEGDIKTVTVSMSRSGKCFVCFSCDNVTPKIYPPANKIVGIDVGLLSFCVDSDGNKFDNPRYYRENQKLLRLRSRSLARRKKGSKRRNKARILVAKAHEKVKNQREDFLHKVTNHYIENYKEIKIEDLNIQSMVKNRHLSKSIADASWGKFFEILSYKAEEAGRMVVKVAPQGTSQLCSQCHEKVPKSLNVRTHACPHCGFTADRDYNSAVLIKHKRGVGQTPQALT